MAGEQLRSARVIQSSTTKLTNHEKPRLMACRNRSVLLQSFRWDNKHSLGQTHFCSVIIPFAPRCVRFIASSQPPRSFHHCPTFEHLSDNSLSKTPKTLSMTFHVGFIRIIGPSEILVVNGERSNMYAALARGVRGTPERAVAPVSPPGRLVWESPRRYAVAVFFFHLNSTSCSGPRRAEKFAVRFGNPCHLHIS